MIESLLIERVAVVEHAELEFGPGLNVLTGETGAGKSIVLGALSLLVGARASADAVRVGAEEGAVEAVFRTHALPELEHDLDELGLLSQLDREQHELCVRRTIGRNGRSRVRLGGQRIPVSTLAELFAGRVEISSQHASHALLRREVHGRLLDAAGGLLARRQSVEEGAAALRALDTELVELRRQAEERLRRSDFLSFQLREIDEAGLEPGELDRLAREHTRLAHAERLRAEGSAVYAAIAGDPLAPDATVALDRLAGAARALENLEKIDPDLGELAGRLREADTELRDVAADLERYIDSIDGDPARLAQVEERLAQLDHLRRKYGESIEEILDTRAQMASELNSIQGSDERIEALQTRRGELAASLARNAGHLSAGRNEAAGRIQGAVEAELRSLAMPRARFRVALEPAPGIAAVGDLPPSPCGPRGAEIPEFLFASSPGTPLRSLQKVASGGELSRLFLSLKGALRRDSAGVVLVFDEVDSGIGGGVAELVGRKLAELAAHHQVLCITHLPQIAAFADVHLRVERLEKKGESRAEVRRLSGAERLEEIARMAGGEKIGEATRRHAEELLRARGPEKPPVGP